MSTPSIDRVKFIQPHTPAHSIYERPRGIEIVHEDSRRSGICFKIFVVVAVILAAITIIVGTLALMASKGWMPTGGEMSSNLGAIGEVNSLVMITGGSILFVLAMLAWSWQICKENHHTHRHFEPGVVRRLTFEEVIDH